MYTVITCPTCGANLTQGQKVCRFCGNQIVRKDGIDIDKIKELVDKKMYKAAQSMCERLIQSSPDDSDAYFYYAIALMEGKKPFLIPRKTIDKCIDLLDCHILYSEDKRKGYLLRAYIEYDYFERKCLNRNPSYKHFYDLACIDGDVLRLRNELETELQQTITIKEAQHGK